MPIQDLFSLKNFTKFIINNKKTSIEVSKSRIKPTKKSVLRITIPPKREKFKLRKRKIISPVFPDWKIPKRAKKTSINPALILILMILNFFVLKKCPDNKSRQKGKNIAKPPNNPVITLLILLKIFASLPPMKFFK